MPRLLDRRHWISCTAFLVVFLILGLATGSISLISDLAFVLAGISLVALIACFVGPRRDPYSFAELERVHERAELDAIEEAQMDEALYIVCASCGEPFPKELHRCPSCKCRC